MGKSKETEYTLPTPIEIVDASAVKTLRDMHTQATTPVALEEEVREVEKVRQGTSVDIVELAAAKGDFFVKVWNVVNESGTRHKWEAIRIFPRPKSAAGRFKLWMTVEPQSLKLGGKYYWDGVPFTLNYSSEDLNQGHETRARRLQELWDAGNRDNQQAIVRLATIPRGDILTPVIDRLLQR
jgi:hypothetical protein